MVTKNGFEFELTDIVVDHDEEISKERTEENGYDTAVVSFNVTVYEITKQDEVITRYPYELKGNIEYDEDGAEAEFDNGAQYISTITLVSGDVYDREFNQAIKDYFAEDCDFNSFIYDQLDEETQNKLAL